MGLKGDALLHVSMMGVRKGLLTVGECLEVYVVEVDAAQGRVKLSLEPVLLDKSHDMKPTLKSKQNMKLTTCFAAHRKKHPVARVDQRHHTIPTTSSACRPQNSSSPNFIPIVPHRALLTPSITLHGVKPLIQTVVSSVPKVTCKKLKRLYRSPASVKK